MFRDVLVERDQANTNPIDIANPNPEPVKSNLQKIGFAPGRLNAVDSIEAFSRAYLRRAAEELVIGLRQPEVPDVDCMLLAGCGHTDGRKVIGLGQVTDGELELTLEDGRPPYVGTNLSPVGAPPPLTFGALLTRLDVTEAKRLTIVTSSGEHRPIIGAAPITTNTGAGSGRWQMLVTARSVS
jgi:hypothetical protein